MTDVEVVVKQSAERKAHIVCLSYVGLNAVLQYIEYNDITAVRKIQTVMRRSLNNI
jgi:hypothetical protein